VESPDSKGQDARLNPGESDLWLRAIET